MDVRVRVGRNLRRYRLAKGVSQEELAHCCELHHTYVSRIERGVRNPTVVVLERLAGVPGIAAAALLETQTDERAGETRCPLERSKRRGRN
jgi:transcriptional regulator with XRE-family HTH domain